MRIGRGRLNLPFGKSLIIKIVKFMSSARCYFFGHFSFEIDPAERVRKEKQPRKPKSVD